MPDRRSTLPIAVELIIMIESVTEEMHGSDRFLT